MNTKTLSGIGIGVGLSALLGLGTMAFGEDTDEAPRTRQAAAMERQVEELFERMGVDPDEFSREEMVALIEAMNTAGGDAFATMNDGWNVGGNGQAHAGSWDAWAGQGGYAAQEFTADDLMLLNAFAQMFAGTGYGSADSLGYLGSTGYGGYGDTGYASGQGQGGWSGGDNYYSSRVGTGNYNADNSAGYVYIPGTGSVSYGM